MNRHSTPLSLKVRRRLVIGLLTMATVGILTRAVYLQVVHKDFLQDQGDERYLRVMQIPAYRGMIVDRNGEPLAVSSPVDSAWANPVVLLSQRDQLASLAKTLEFKQNQLKEKLEKRSNKEFAYLRRHLPPDTAQRVMD
ncbi:MAG: hypothetical protein HC808_14060 [Candidatus Competibacteraceae bacterium]|nr:hypothetical protein [Candidatus Competibacteraceae bacterium]